MNEIQLENYNQKLDNSSSSMKSHKIIYDINDLVVALTQSKIQPCSEITTERLLKTTYDPTYFYNMEGVPEIIINAEISKLTYQIAQDISAELSKEETDNFCVITGKVVINPNTFNPYIKFYVYTNANTDPCAVGNKYDVAKDHWVKIPAGTKIIPTYGVEITTTEELSVLTGRDFTGVITKRY